MQVSEVLERSLRKLEAGGWCKHTYEGEDGGRCIVSALWSTISEELTWPEGGRLLMIDCQKALQAGTPIPNLARWNDDPERTFSHVSEVFRRAICEAELKELVAA